MDNPVVLGYTETDRDCYDDKYHVVFLSTYINEDDVTVTRCNHTNLDSSSEFTVYNNLREALKQDKHICSDCIDSMFTLWIR